MTPALTALGPFYFNGGVSVLEPKGKRISGCELEGKGSTPLRHPTPTGVALRTVWTFDTETDGLLKDVTRIHCLILKDRQTGFVARFRRNAVMDNIRDGLKLIEEIQNAGGIIRGHNSIEYDVPVIRKIYPDAKIIEELVEDTIVEARLIYPDLTLIDAKIAKRRPFPKHLHRRHSLEAWGYRLNCNKAGYEGDSSIADPVERKKRKWEAWNQEMEDYCVQDIEVTEKLGIKLDSHEYSQQALDLERAVAWIVARQQRYGFMFDEKAAGSLYARLVAHKLTLEATLSSTFPPLYIKQGETFIPKADNKRLHYTAGVPITKVKRVPFNPGSRDHIALMFTRKYQWKPTEYTNEGKPKVDEAVLGALPYPEAKPLHEAMMVSKRIGQLAEGKEAWLRHVKNGRIHCRIVTNGAVTGRMTHSSPNLGQVPASYSPYGKDCRALFIVPKGKVLIGADASALELCDLAGYMAAYDDGAYIATVLKGDKSNGTDIHSVNARALGLDPKQCYYGTETGRDLAKTWFYAFVYGAGDEKLGAILLKIKGISAVERGKKSRADFMANLPALKKLLDKIKSKVKSVGTLKGLDGRVLHIRSQHAAPNTLLQSAGAVQMKMALVILDRELQARGYKNSNHALPNEVNYEFVMNCHDEWQIEADEDLGETIGKLAVAAITKAGEVFKFRCPLSGEYNTGRNWSETH